MATEAQRNHMVALMDLMIKHKSQLDYPPHDHRGQLDQRTFMMTEQQMVHVLNDGGRLMMDCSEFVTEICRWAGLRDPNGLSYRYAGYTGTLLSYLPHYEDPAKAFPGAIVVLGPGTGDHAVMVYKKGKDPVIVSHGRAGLDVMPLSREASFHRPPVRLLSIAHL